MFGGDLPWERWSEEVIRYCNRKAWDEELITAAGESRSRLYLAHYLIAMKRIADNRMEDAQPSLKQCEETNYLGGYWPTAFRSAIDIK
jgi:hypothetical protein